MAEVHAPLQAQLVQWLVQPGDIVAAGDVLVILEAMKMEHEVRATQPGKVLSHYFVVGELVQQGDLLLKTELLPHYPRPETPKRLVISEENAPPADATAARADLARLQQRLAFTTDAARPEAVAKRHAQGLRTARENIADLCDPGGDSPSFIEYGALAVAAQRTRRSEQDLIQNTPADGMVTGIGQVHGRSTVVMA
ncbi:MAG: biotin/lipoyl-binding protein, partial [Candidatus Saccharibacteria bacterium]|nr:biotin/lipoyl-binding protein [Rhodoferax sp.]